MNRPILKTILGGVLLGTALFFVPFFFFKVLIFFLIFGMIFRFFGRHRGYRGPYGWAFADKIRGMNDQEYETFKEQMRERRCGHYATGHRSETTKPSEQ